MKFLIVFTLLALISTSIDAQIKIFGNVKDSTGQPLFPVTISLLEGDTLIRQTVSENSGKFSISFFRQNGKSYRVKLVLMGYESRARELIETKDTIQLDVVMKEEGQSLATVNISARRPLIERKVDRNIVNVENSSFAQGNSALEVLQKSPGVWVNQDGSIRIKGNQSVMVMINDVVQRMSELDLAEYLKSLRSDQISKIEIIHNPPAEFEAAGSGGIIHIILKKSRQDGGNGSLYARYQQQGKNPWASTGGSLAYKLKKMYFSGNLSYAKDKNSSLGESTTIYPDQTVFNNQTQRINNNSRYQYRVSASYDISHQHFIGFQNSASVNKPLQSFLTNINYQKASPLLGTANADWDRDISFNSTTLNYVWKIDSIGSSLKIIGDYSRNGKNEQNNLSTVYNDALQNSTSRTTTPSSTHIYAAQADYTKIWKNKIEFKAGLKYTSVDRDNQNISEEYISNEWIYDPLISSHFTYNEQLSMLYTSLEKNIDKTSVKFGVRMEETKSTGKSLLSNQGFNRKYFGLFPSFYIMHTFNEIKGNSIFLNYSAFVFLSLISGSFWLNIKNKYNESL